MHSIIVVPAHSTGPASQLRLAPGESLTFGRRATGPGAPAHHLPLTHGGVSRTAGRITATGTYWTIGNLSAHQTYVVENPEGAGEHIKVAPGRIDAPVPFEFSRVVLPAAGDLLSFEVWAPRHDYADPTAPDGPDDGTGAELTAPAFPLDRTKRYFQVLAALCEPRLRGAPHAPLPTVEQITARLRPVWPAAGRASVQWNVDYLAVKLRLKQPPEAADGGPRLNGKKESLVSLALRFNLVDEDDLAVLDGRAPA
ncbi:FHA domain-containing protein [Streptomyces benahoarensis]|uniref:FHA domain-containing protein n=1 Tax=Streptomyces benahoarensis TaxID=2595054 RepID=A0A553ZGY8_9ACTN|nr:FHA domain-containing protein [Streptomyces benahoarensis]TSB21535.1 FHA domain-containing protein [Streptomyces benahoarensis]TSB40733.1 FHA domain-containing protein [Streptomyces benahoarensis]